MRDMRSFSYKGKTLYYYTKDININERSRNGVEMASCYMEVFDENHTPFDVFHVYDEMSKILYAMPADAKVWFEKHVAKKY